MVCVKGVRDTHPVATQKTSNDHIRIWVGSLFKRARVRRQDDKKAITWQLDDCRTIHGTIKGDCRDGSHASGSHLHRHRARYYTILVRHEHALRRMTARGKKWGHKCDSESDINNSITSEMLSVSAKSGLRQLRLNGAQTQERNQRDKVRERIDQLKEANAAISHDDWISKLRDKYQNSRNVVDRNMPELWPGLEFELSILLILNIGMYVTLHRYHTW